MTTDTATIQGPEITAIRTDGPCLAGTLGALETGPTGLPAAAIPKVRADAIALLEIVVSQYARLVAAGEVGADGSGRAQGTAAGLCTGLLYGRIQSGKTVAMISLVAAAMDNGFRVVVVLTSDNVTLVSQTAERFAALDGPIALDARNPASWSGDQAHIAKNITRSGVVFVCSKNVKRLESLIDFLTQVGAPGYPALILDDEADQATLDANLASRVNALKKGKGDVDPTAVNGAVDDLRTALPHHVFLQVTATPYALLLQSVGTSLRPTFTRLLEPAPGYTGGEYFFESRHVDGPEPPVVLVDDNESETLKAGSGTPEGLRGAIAFFLIAAAAQGIVNPRLGRGRQNFLCHTSQLKNEHQVVGELIRDYVSRIDDELEGGAGESVDRLRLAYDDLLKTLSDAPPFERIVEQIRKRVVGRRVVIVNAETDDTKGPGLNLIVGGNILGRGVTIENLLVTYYMREPKIGQMDTMLQHARMYGYREPLMPLTRVFLPLPLALRFHEIHRIEGRLRKYLETADMQRGIPIERIASLQPSRRGVLDPDYLDAFSAGDHCYPLYANKEPGHKEFERISSRIQKLCGGTLPDHGEGQVVSIGFDDLLSLVDEFPYDTKQERSSWVPRGICSILEKQKDRLQGRAYLHSRKLREKNTFSTGALSGEGLRLLRNVGAPVFCAFRYQSAEKPYWYPTIVFDHEMPSMVVNVGPDAPRAQ